MTSSNLHGHSNPAIASRRIRRRPRRLIALLLAGALAPASLALPPDRAGLLAISRAAAAENVTIDKLEIPNKAGSVTLSGISVAGSSLPRAEIEAILKAEAIGAIVEKLDKFSAERMTIGSIEWILKGDGQDIRTVYEGFEATSIKAGLIDRTIIRSGTQSMTMKIGGGKPQASLGKIGRMSVDSLDLAGIVRWLAVGDPAASAPKKVLYGRYELDSMDFATDEASFHIGRTVASGFKARLMKKPLMDIMPEFEKVAANKDQDPNDPAVKEAGLRMLASVLDMYAAFEFGEGTIDGIQFSGKDKTNGQVVAGSFGRITFGGSGKPGLQLNDIEIKAPDGAFRLKKIGFEGDAYALALTGFQTAIASVTDISSPSEAELRKALQEATAQLAIKDIAMRFEGMDGDFPPAKDAKSKERVKFSLGGFELTMGAFVGLTPTRLDYSLTAFKFPVPADSKDDGIKTLRELGIDVIDLSARIKGTWDEAKSRFLIDDVNADLGKIGKVTLRGEIGGVPRPFFENPKDNWPALLGGGNVQSVTLAIDNKGGLEKLIAKTAKEQKKTADQLRLELSGFAPVMVATFLAGHPDATALAETLTKFIKAPGSLSVTARAAAPAGISILELAGAANDPSSLLQKIRIDSSAR